MTPYAALEFVGRCLTPGVAGTGAVRERLSSGEVVWETVISVASAHLVVPSLYRALEARAVLVDVPSEVTNYLQAVQQLNQDRNATLGRELVRVVAELNGMSIKPLLLKGAIGLLGREDPSDPDRVVGDLDILVPARELDVCLDHLLSVGYQEHGTRAYYAQHHHGPILVHPESGVAVELHRAVSPGYVRWSRGTEEVWKDAEAVSLPGLECLVPSPEMRLLHNFVHAQFSDGSHAFRRVQLRQLLEFARLRAAYEAEIDWARLVRRLPGRRSVTPLMAYLLAAERFLGQSLPDSAIAGWRARVDDLLLAMQVRHPGSASLFHWMGRLGQLPGRLTAPSWCRRKARGLAEKLTRRKYTATGQ